MKPTERKNPGGWPGRWAKRHEWQENNKLISPYRQAKICYNCRYFFSGFGCMTAFHCCRIYRERVRPLDKHCSFFRPRPDYAGCLNLRGALRAYLIFCGFIGKLGFPSRERPSRCLIHAPHGIKVGFFCTCLKALFALLQIGGQASSIRKDWRSLSDRGMLARFCMLKPQNREVTHV